jgi:SNF2 family DNA or RNA helicase
MLVEDQATFEGIEFSVLVCDEAHELKESKTLRSQAVSAIRAKSKFLATGTPIQNRLQDYWALLNIVDVGLLGDREQFSSILANTPSDARKLMIQTKHRILRRTQEQVGIELPEGIETYVPLALPENLQSEYEDLKFGVSRYSPPLQGLAAFPKLRQFSAHPRSVIGESPAQLSPKETFLLDELDQISQADEKVVVFVADFNEPLDLYKSLVQFEYRNAWVGVIDGRTDVDVRHAMLARFTEFEGFAVLLVNPQVGGQGLDMVAANHVLHMNPAWNPAKTDQATFRVTRPGQKRKTTTHHLYYVDTIEESIMTLVSNKRELSDAALEEAERDYELNKKTIGSIFKLEGAGNGRNV